MESLKSNSNQSIEAGLNSHPLQYYEGHKSISEQPSLIQYNDDQLGLTKDKNEKFKRSIDKNLKRIAKLSIVDENRLDQSVDSWEGNSPVFLKNSYYYDSVPNQSHKRSPSPAVTINSSHEKGPK